MKNHTPINESREVLAKMSEIILKTFSNFGVDIKVVKSQGGLRAYHFELEMVTPTRMKTVTTFVDDLRYALGTDNVEIEAPIPDKKLIGIKVTKPVESITIPLKEALAEFEFNDASPLIVPLGVGEFGELHQLNIARTPHMLIGGATGSGKSIFLHTIINSLIEFNGPDQLRFIICDPKRTDLTLYNKIPYLLTPVITDGKKMAKALSWANKEMDRRYDLLESEKVQGISYYHDLVYKPALEKWQKQGSKAESKESLPEPLPYIVIICDEMNDLMQAYPKETETSLIRLAQMGRAVGIHLILATQRPSVNVITGMLKANIPTRIALSVASQVDSRTILDQAGAEKLHGNGDMILLIPDQPKLQRFQGYYISEEEIKERVKKLSVEPSLKGTNDLDLSDSSPQSFMASLSEDAEGEDDLYEDAKEAVIEAGKCSTSYLQRKFRIGYSRAARLVDLLEETGVIGPADGVTPREVLIEPNEEDN